MLLPALLFARQHEARVVSADVADYLLLDVTPESYANIDAELGVSRWSPATEPCAFPVRGILWPPNMRIVLPLQCRVGSRAPILLHMLLNTGAPGTLLCADSPKRLGFTAPMPAEALVMLHGCRVKVTRSSHSHFASNDVLGADWLLSARAHVLVDYGQLLVHVEGSAPSAAALRLVMLDALLNGHLSPCLTAVTGCRLHLTSTCPVAFAPRCAAQLAAPTRQPLFFPDRTLQRDATA